MKGGLLTHMLIAKEMSVEEIYANVTEMLLAGVDTVCVLVNEQFTHCYAPRGRVEDIYAISSSRLDPSWILMQYCMTHFSRAVQTLGKTPCG